MIGALLAAWHAASLLALAVSLGGAAALAAALLFGAFARPLVIVGLVLIGLGAFGQMMFASAAHEGAMREAQAKADAAANDLRRQLAERKADLANAQAASAAASERAGAYARLAARSREFLDAYQAEIAARGPTGACGLGDGDVARLLPRLERVPDGGELHPGALGAPPAGRGAHRP